MSGPDDEGFPFLPPHGLSLVSLLASAVISFFGSLVFTVIGAALVMLERARPFPHWLPQAISFPVAWALILPSRLEFGGSWLSWLIFGAIAAGTFFVHWYALNWARGIWD